MYDITRFTLADMVHNVAPSWQFAAGADAANLEAAANAGSFSITCMKIFAMPRAALV